MVKTPEEYFEEQEFTPQASAGEQELTEAEKAFLEKYLGLEETDILDKLGIGAPVEPERVAFAPLGQEGAPAPSSPARVEEQAIEAVARPLAAVAEDEALVLAPAEVEAEVEAEEVQDFAEDQGEALAEEVPAATEQAVAAEEAAPRAVAAPAEQDDFERELRREKQLQLVSFFLGGQEFTVPIQAVQEVVRAVPVTKLPETPEYFAGIVNLRGRVTPLVRLVTLLKPKSRRAPANGEGAGRGEERFIVVCRRKGLQVGLLVENMGTMYRVGQDVIEWNIEGRMGGTAEFVKALMRSGEDLIGVLSVDSIVDKLTRK